MPKLSVAHKLAQSSLFEASPQCPRWEDLPTEVRRRVTRLLSELLLSSVAQPQRADQAEGGNDE
jgi:hypothetical protein